MSLIYCIWHRSFNLRLSRSFFNDYIISVTPLICFHLFHYYYKKFLYVVFYIILVQGFSTFSKLGPLKLVQCSWAPPTPGATDSSPSVHLNCFNFSPRKEPCAKNVSLIFHMILFTTEDRSCRQRREHRRIFTVCLWAGDPTLRGMSLPPESVSDWVTWTGSRPGLPVRHTISPTILLFSFRD